MGVYEDGSILDDCEKIYERARPLKLLAVDYSKTLIT